MMAMTTSSSISVNARRLSLRRRMRAPRKKGKITLGPQGVRREQNRSRGSMFLQLDRQIVAFRLDLLRELGRALAADGIALIHTDGDAMLPDQRAVVRLERAQDEVA